MSDRSAGRLWLLLGAFFLTLLWVAVLGRFPWLDSAGIAFLSVPFLGALVMTAGRTARDPLSAVAVLGLCMLFCLSWFT